MTKTEDDTFNALRQTPFIRLFVMCARQGITLGDDIIWKNLSFIVSNGWTEDEFRQRLLLELHLDNISMDIMLITDSDWQRSLLEKTFN